MPRLLVTLGTDSRGLYRPGHKVYLLLAAIVLLILFAASYGGRSTWVALASSTLSVMLVAGCAFIANAGSAGPYFNALSAQTHSLLRGGVQDLAFAAERTTAHLAEIHQRPASAAAAPIPAPVVAPSAPETARVAVAPVADPALADPAPDPTEADDADWLELSWIDQVGWLSAAASWLNPWHWFETQEVGTPVKEIQASNNVPTKEAELPEPQAQAPPPAPMPTVRAMMQPEERTREQQAAAAPSYRIVTVPPQQGGPVTAPLPASPGTPVEWLSGVSPPEGVKGVLLSGTNASSVPLEDIQATLKPDAEATPPSIDKVVLSLRVEGRDGTVAPGAAAVPPGARFHLQAANLSDEAAAGLGGAIVSFAYSQDGRRRTSIMYLKQSALDSGGTGPQ